MSKHSEVNEENGSANHWLVPTEAATDWPHYKPYGEGQGNNSDEDRLDDAVNANDKLPELAMDGGKEQMEEDDALVVFHCWLCSIDFVEKLDIIRHLKGWHKDRPDVQRLDRLLKIPVCLACGVQGPCDHQSGEPEEFEDDDDDSEAVTVRPRFLLCVSCPEKFLAPETLFAHRIEAHPGEPVYQCSFCPEIYKEHPDLVMHSRIHQGRRPYICTTCGNRFSRQSDLKRHEAIHLGVKPFCCRLCGLTFTQKSSLEKHTRMHARRSGQIACFQCGLLFESYPELRVHSQAEHEGSNFQCDTCGKTYTDEWLLVNHKKTHEPGHVKPFACNFCDRRFTLKHLLVRHEKRLHHREIKCHICHKIFKRNENLTRHMLSHSGVKNFQCLVCGVWFIEKSSLTRHYRKKHQYVGRHTCTICRQSFASDSLLRSHIEKKQTCITTATKILRCRRDFFRCKLCLKLLAKSGRRQHGRFHRSKADVWEGDLGEELEPSRGDKGDVERLFGPVMTDMLERRTKKANLNNKGDEEVNVGDSCSGGDSMNDDDDDGCGDKSEAEGKLCNNTEDEIGSDMGRRMEDVRPFCTN